MDSVNLLEKRELKRFRGYAIDYMTSRQAHLGLSRRGPLSLQCTTGAARLQSQRRIHEYAREYTHEHASP
ncbi:hypothetical protein [Paraburkholderia gardini]|uniref:hypothetical protein n=1 Tax=Paraburkholderia gardini TaxID=2823469 RepID=UPI001E4F726E|nr:hypothetical protein [Paraburkholderia gardini]